MTPATADRPQMPVEDFEQLAATAPETVTLEFVNGKLEVKPVPDGDHDEILMWVQEQCMRHRPDVRLYRERGIKAERYRRGRARPDGVLAPRGHFAGDGEWSDPDGLLMVVEVTSHDRDTNQRDRLDKRDAYAAAGIPVYLLVDRDDCTVTVHADPDHGTYRSRTSRPWGVPVDLPEPVGLPLDTEELKDYAR